MVVLNVLKHIYI